jgi:hypothetical protein
MTDSVFKEKSLRWNGDDVFFVPDITMLRRIRGEGIQNLKLAHECLVGGADPADFTIALKHMLRQGGVKASDDECYDWLTSADVEDILQAQTAYVESVNPRIDLGKKPEAPAEKAPKTKTKAKTS